ncbi:hypothetical protein O6H91_18G077700 [Diphasiastrum complanatum]|uniref:Uncharacterized protein n=1 Tax=Diphasiastrum complanatum TaxID=34168 RepID=A0ACC2B2X4_DIPCM|nr:hypothetical protein O6H91_18G077700 [Diphasiastrum complanatum]
MTGPVQPVEQASDLLQKLKLDSQTKSTEKLEIAASHDSSSLDSNGDVASSVVVDESVNNNTNFEGIVDSGIYYAANGYIPHGYVYDYGHGGYESPIPGEWEEYPRYVGVDGVEIPHSGFYGENAPVIFHQPGYGYASQPTYGPYSPAAQMPTMGADGQLYGPSAFQYRGPIYQQTLPPGAPYFPPVIVSEGPATTEASPQASDGSSPAVPSNGNVVPLGPRPGFPLAMMPPHGPYPRGVIPMNVQNPGPQDVRAGFEGFRPTPVWPDVSKNGDGQPRPGNPGTAQMITQPIPGPGHPTQHLRPLPQTQVRASAPQPHRPTRASSPGLGPGSLGRGYPPLSRGIPNLSGTGRAGRGSGGHEVDFRANGNGRTWIGGDKNKLRERAFEHLSNGSSNGNGNLNGQMDVLNEQNRGPRISRIRNQRPTPLSVNQMKGQNGHSTPNGDISTPLPREQYNLSDFTTSYSDAKFFVIKSYSEDDVHKSIKYQVWASTPNGNKRLDGAYQEAQARATGKQGSCPVFLLFSVNASGQFCGLAEMTGPVDFIKSVDYWQQDKWSGQFSVKWHIIKDIPNSQFRHIILENNDNKPVTNSRDTQEIKFEQGIEILNIFKNFPSKTSILDDFQFYDNRQKAMQDKKIRQQAQQQRQQVRTGDLYDQRTFEAPLKPKTEKDSDSTVNGSAIPGATLNGTPTSGSVVPTTAESTDCSTAKNGEVSALELSSDSVSAQNEVVETAFQRKSYLRSLKEGKVENGSANNVPKNMDVKASVDDKKIFVAGGETK